jgi:hypothetical protein
VLALSKKDVEVLYSVVMRSLNTGCAAGVSDHPLSDGDKARISMIRASLYADHSDNLSGDDARLLSYLLGVDFDHTEDLNRAHSVSEVRDRLVPRD